MVIDDGARDFQIRYLTRRAGLCFMFRRRCVGDEMFAMDLMVDFTESLVEIGRSAYRFRLQ